MLVGTRRRLLRRLFLVVLASTFTGCSTEPSQFEQIGYHKKQLANGANFRVFSVYVNEFSDSPDIWSKVESHAKGQSYTAGGTTMVFFFNDRRMTPDVTFIGEKFDEKYEPYCIAGYWKYPNGKQQFTKFPFKK